jgi:esterase FrsA
LSYQWPLDPQGLFTERYAQMLHTGLPVDDVDAVCAAIAEMWTDAPGGWVYEWSKLAAGYTAGRRHDLAALAYGWAKFPTLADDAKRTAFARQIEQYERAAAGFPVTLERRVLDLAYQGATTRAPVHLLGAPDLPVDAPVLIASGGVDTWKMDLHLLLVAFALQSGARVLAFDIPGTGESEVPLNTGADEVIRGLVAAARGLGNGKVAHLGISMGGNFAAMSGLSGIVDAAVVLGGPVDASFEPEHAKQLLYGMADIIGNACGFSSQPTPDQLAEAMRGLSRHDLLAQGENAPMLVINGADDVHVPQADTLAFEGRPNTEVHLVPDTGHCALSKFDEVIPMMIGWLARHVGA